MKNSEQCEFLADKKPSEKVFWKVIRNLDNGNQIPDCSILPNTKTNEDKVILFADFFEKIFTNDSVDTN
jgi:hypothetical protein